MCKKICSVFLSVLLCILCLAGCKSTETASENAETVPYVSLYELSENPDEYLGKRVRVVGFPFAGFEADQLNSNLDWSSIFLSLDFDNSIMGERKKEYWKDLGFDTYEDMQNLNEKCLEVEGVFSDRVPAWPWGYFASLTDISEYKLWEGGK